MTLYVAMTFKRMYLWKRTGYKAGLWLILEVINCTLTWYNKQKIEGLREVPPFFLRSGHILLFLDESFLVSCQFTINYC